MHVQYLTMAACRLMPLAIAVTVIAILTAGPPGYAQTYKLTDLGTLPGGTQSNSRGINDIGQATGVSNTSNSNVWHGFLYSNGVMKDLGVLPGAVNSGGFGINSTGQIVGVSSVLFSSHAFLYSNGVMKDIGTLIGPSGSSSGTGINDAGQLTGLSSTANGGPDAFLYSNGKMTDLGWLGGPSNPGLYSGSEGFGINSAGDVTGVSDVYTPAYYIWHAFLYSNGSGKMKDLGTLGGVSPPLYGSEGFAINSADQVTGASSTATGATDAFLYSNGSMTDIGTLLGGPSNTVGPSVILSEGNAINDTGQITGWSLTANGGQHAFLYSSGRMADLNSLIDPRGPLVPYVTLTQGDAISGNGWIEADGVNSRTGMTHAYLLSPSSGRYCQQAGELKSCFRPIAQLCVTDPAACRFVCALPGCENSVINWSPPVFVGIDPWRDGVSLNMVVETPEQARNLAAGLRVVVDTGPRVQPVSGRITTAELLDHGALRLQRVVVVGPQVDVSVAVDAPPAVQALAAPAGHLMAELSLPYVATATAPGTNLRMVQFDKATSRWMDVNA